MTAPASTAVAVVDAVRAELRKALTLPAAIAALVLSVVGPVALAALYASSPDIADSAADAALAAAPLLTLGAIVIGVVVVGSEYTGSRPIATTFAAMPHRTTVLAAKVVAVTALVAGAAAVAYPAALLVAQAVIGDGVSGGDGVPGGRWLGAAVYAILTALIALAITVLTRSGVVPLIVLVANGSVVSISFLLSKVTPLARYLPDLAGMRMIADGDRMAVEDALAPLPGGLVMAAWTAALLAVAAVVLSRRDG